MSNYRNGDIPESNYNSDDSNIATEFHTFKPKNRAVLGDLNPNFGSRNGASIEAETRPSPREIKEWNNPGKPATWVPGGLAPVHKEELAASGITPEIAKELGIRTLYGPQLRTYGIFKEEFLVDDGSIYLIYPYWRYNCTPVSYTRTSATGVSRSYPYASVKLPPEKIAANNGGKYYRPAGVGSKLYVPYPIEERFKDLLVGGKRCDIRIVEGEKKAIASTVLTKVPTLAISGVYCYKVAGMIDFLTKAKRTQIVFDNDIHTNENVAAALKSFGAWAETYWSTLAKIFILENGSFLSKDNERFLSQLEDTLIQKNERGADIYPSFGAAGAASFFSPDKLKDRLESLHYTLLPRSPHGLKLGIDDYLVGGSPDCELKRLLLDTWLPLRGVSESDPDIRRLWKDTDEKRTVSLYGDNGEIYDWAKKSFVKAADAAKKGASLAPRSKYEFRDLAAYLVAATSKLGSLTIDADSGESYVWRNDCWNHVDKDDFALEVARAMGLCKFSDGNSGLFSLAVRQVKTYCREPFPQSDWIGIGGGQDLNLLSGKVEKTDFRHRVIWRTKFKLASGAPNKFVKGGVELLGEEQFALLRACLRLSMTPVKTQVVEFLPAIVGEAGCGKTALMKVVLGVLPGGAQVDFSLLKNKSAMDGYVDMKWYKRFIVADLDCKFGGRFSNNMAAVFNKAVDRSQLEFKTMGKSPKLLDATFRPWIVTNNLPKPSGSDAEGYHRRILPLQCVHSRRVKADKKISWASEVLEEEGDKILNWIFELSVEEANQQVADALDSSKHVEVQRELRIEEHEALARWMAEVVDGFATRATEPENGVVTLMGGDNIELNSYTEAVMDKVGGELGDVWVSSSEAYEHYVGWMGTNRGQGKAYAIKTVRTFVQNLKLIGAEQVKGSDGKNQKFRFGQGKRLTLIKLVDPGLDY